MEDTSSERSPLGMLAEEFVERYRKGQRPSLTEYAERAPELADEIRSLFPTLVEMEQLKPVTGDHTGHYSDSTLPDLERLGEFRILRRVGVGGMGVVYEAVQESLGRHVALKVLPSDALADPKRLERFRREAKAAARLHHTNIVPVFGTGDADGRHYYAMQFITGHPLDAVIDEVQRLKGQGPTRGEVSQAAQGLVSGTFPVEDPEATTPAVAPLPDAPGVSPSSLTSGSLSGGRSYWATVARIGEQVASALSYAHGQGVLHRDIKPANLLLDLHGTVWVADFGLAKAHDSDGLTHAGDIVGTLRYMAPERFDGGGDQRADVYALGLTLYELLTLTSAFNSENRAKLVEQVVAAVPPTPRSINSAIPRDLETIVLKAIARDPAMRYQSAGEMADDLRRYREDRPIAARRASRFEQARRWCRRNPAVAGLMAGLFLVFATGAGVSALFAVRAERNEAEARQNAANAQRNADDARRNAAEAKANLDRAERSSQQAARSAAEASDNARIATENARQAAAREKEAVEGREQLQREQDHARRLIYDSQIHQTSVALGEERIPRVRQLLEATKPKPGEPDLRGWEWHYLNRQIQPPPATELRLVRDTEFQPKGKSAEIEVSTDGRHLIHNRWSADGAWFEIWNLSTLQRVGRVPREGSIPFDKSRFPGMAAQSAYSDAVVSPDGKYLAAVWQTPKPEARRTESHLRLWDVATGTEVPGPTDLVRLYSGQFRIAPDGKELVWIEIIADTVVPASFSGRLNQPLEIARWTRETGKIDRKRIKPQRGEVEVSVDPEFRNAVALPFVDRFGSPLTGLGEIMQATQRSDRRSYEAWDLSGDMPKSKDVPAFEKTGGTEATCVASGLTGGGPGAFAVADSKELAVFRFADSAPLWRLALPEGKKPSAHLLGVSEDGGRAVFSDADCFWVFCKSGEGVAAAGNHWIVRHEGIAPNIVRRVTTDGKRIVTAVTGPPSQPGEILVRLTDIERNFRGPKLLPDQDSIWVQRVGRPELPKGGGGPKNGPNGIPGFGRGPSDEAQIPPYRGFAIRPARGGGAEYGRIPDVEPNRRQYAVVIGDGRRVLADSSPADPKSKAGAKGSTWQLFAPKGPGDMPLVASGTGTVHRGLMVARHDDFFYTLDRETDGADAGGFRTVIVLYDSVTGASLGRVEPSFGDNEALLALDMVPKSDRVLVATRPARIGDSGIVALHLCDRTTGKEIWKAEAGPYPHYWHQCFSPDGLRAYCGIRFRSGQTDVAVVRLADGVVERTFRVLEGDPNLKNTNDAPLAQIAGVCPDGRLAIITGDEVQLWDCNTGQLGRRFPDNAFGAFIPAEAVRLMRPEPVRFSEDGRRMFVAGAKLHVWDTTTGQELMALAYPGSPGDGRRVLRVDGDKLTVRTGIQMREFDGTPVKP